MEVIQTLILQPIS